MIRLIWDNISISEWRGLVDRAIRPPLSISWPYAVAQLKTHRRKARFGVLEVDDQPVGLVQILETSSLKGLVRHTEWHGGPIWLTESIDPAWQQYLLQQVRLRYPRRPGHQFRAFPNHAGNPELWQKAGFRRVGEGYQTIWLDLRPDLDVLHRQLRANWRNKLNKAARHQLRIFTDHQGSLLPWLATQHDAFRQQRGFVGPGNTFLLQLGLQMAPAQELFLFRADSEEEEGIAGSLFLRHGSAASWLIAWSGEQGRKIAAQNALVWAAICHLKSQGINWLDLGGVNPQLSPELTHFKTGLGGIHTEGPGVFI